MVEILIQNGADVNSRTRDGDTPLSIASRNSYLKIYSLLQEYGATALNEHEWW